MDWKEIQDETTTDLIEYVKSKEDPDYRELAEAAFIVLTFRFREDILKKCSVVMQKWDRSPEDAMELTMSVFNRFFKYPKYDHDKCKKPDVDACFKRYLYGIVNREVINFIYGDDLSPYNGTEEIVTSLMNEEEEYEPERLRVLKEHESRLDEVFRKLTPKHKIIFLTYKTHEINGHKLPRPLLEKLRHELGLTQNSIRVYKKEAVELVESELSNHG